MNNPFREHRGFWTPARKRSLSVGILLLFIAVVIQITAGPYSSRRAMTSSPVGDLFLDNLPVVNLTPVIVSWAIVVWLLAWWLILTDPKRVLFGMKAVSLYLVCRAFFVSLTHVGPYPVQFSPGPENFGFRLYHLFTYQGNYFFSGHTGFPFLIALIFWDEKLWRRFFIFLTCFFGATVLLAHVHYSIDVFAAPFIIYGVFVITARLFPEDYELLPGTRPGLPT